MNKILYRLGWSGGDNWHFSLGIAIPEGLSYMFDNGTQFRAGLPTSYAVDDPIDAITAATARIDSQIADDERRLRTAESDIMNSRKMLAVLKSQQEALRIEAGQLSECRHLVEAFFKGDVDKTRLWFKTKNPLLGELSPDDLVAMHRTEWLLKFIEGQLAENPPRT